MAFVRKDELHSGRTYEAGEGGVVTYERVWRIRTDSAADDQYYVANNSGLPALYSPYPNDSRAKLFPLSVRPDGDESGLLWLATARYSSQTDNSQPEINPLNRDARWSGGAAQFTRLVTRDNSNTAVLNYAGDPYDPPPEIDDDRISFVAVRNEPAIPWTRINTFKGAVNASPWNNAAARTVKVRITFGDLQKENGYQFYPVTYNFDYDPNTWDLSLLEIGYNGIQNIVTDFKVKLGDEPRLLKRVGSNVTIETDPANANFTKWRVRPEIDFNSLGLTMPG